MTSEFNLSKKEKKYILDALLTALSSEYTPESYKGRCWEDFENDCYEEVLKYPLSCFAEDMNEQELELIKNLIKKLAGESQ